MPIKSRRTRQEERNVTMFTERLRGDTLAKIGEPRKLTAERVRQIVAVQATEHLNDLEVALAVARKEGNVLALKVPFDQPDKDMSLAFSYFLWAVAELEKRDIEVRVVPSMEADGPVLYIEDVTNYGGSTS